MIKRRENPYSRRGRDEDGVKVALELLAGWRNRGVCNRTARAEVSMSQVSAGCREWLLKGGVAMVVGECRCCWAHGLRNSSSFRNLSNIRTRITRVYQACTRCTRVSTRVYNWNRHYCVLAYAACNYNFRGLRPPSGYFSPFSFLFALPTADSAG